MFLGATPADLRSLVLESAQAWPRDLGAYVACSGNLTLERVLAPAGFAVHGCDVNVYSCALGRLFAGEPTGVTPNVEELEAAGVGWLAGYCGDDAGTVAALMLGTRFLGFAGKSGAYFDRMLIGYRDQFPALHAGTVAKLRAHPLRLASFAGMDAVDWLERVVPSEAPVASFPPFGSDRANEEQWKPLTRFFSWDAPEYRPIGKGDQERMLAAVTSRPHWLLAVTEELPQLAGQHRGRFQGSIRSKPYHVYASGRAVRIVAPAQRTEQILMPKIGQGDEVTGPLRLHPLNQAQFNGLRAQWLGKGIAVGAPPYSIGVSAGGKLIGAFCYDRPKFNPDEAYLMSDFPIGWTRYRRLSKLVVMAALSSEAQLVMERTFSRRIRSLGTTAFSQNPTSGKYGRGIPGMRLVSRRPADDGVHEWLVNYAGPMGQWDLAKALRTWLRKHASDLVDRTGTDDGKGEE
jgi:hypothetical protein